MTINMDRNEIAIVLLKGLSIYTVLRAIDRLTASFSLLFDTSIQYPLLVALQVVVPPILLTLLAFVLWLIAPKLASLILRDVDGEQTSTITSNDLQVITFSAIGLFVFAESVPHLVRAIVICFGVDVSMMSKEFVIQKNIEVALFLAKGVLGLLLLFGSRGLLKLILSTRRQGPKT